MRTTVLFLVLLVAPAAAVADSWLPFRGERAVSPTGRTYAVVRKSGPGVEVELCRRREGAPPMKPAIAPDEFGIREGSGGPIDRDPGDELLAKVRLGGLPLEVRVLDEPPSFLLLDTYARVGHGTTITYVGRDGEVVFRRRLPDLFDGETIAGFTRTVSSIWWNRGWLVDEEERRLIAVAKGDRLRAVSLADGSVTTPDPSVLLRHLRRGTVGERKLALETAARRKPEGIGPEALALAADESQPLPIRLRAGVAAKRAGEKPRLDPLFLRAVEKGNPGGVRKFAAAHLAEMVGEEAIPVLRRLMRGPADDDVWHACQQAFAALGEKAVPALCGMLLEDGRSADYRGGAAHALKRIGSKRALDALLEATASAEEYVANAAVNAAIALGAPDLGKRLAVILAAGSTQDSRIAMYFEQHPAEYARAPLEKALGRAKEEGFDRKRILDALRALDQNE